MGSNLLWDSARIRWRSRRGLLELDLVLLPYAEKIYDLLTDIEKQHHQWLLQQTDMDLQQWLIHKKPASNLLQWQIQHIESIWHFMQTR